jgi:hypothetical protein
MKIEAAYCKDRYSSMIRTVIDVKKFLIFKPAWLWMVRCMSDDETSEVVWECRENGTYVLLCTKAGGKGLGVVSVFPAVVWVDGKPEIVEWDKMDPGRSEVKDPFYVMVYSRTDLVEFSDLVLSRLTPVVLMVKVSGSEPSKLVKKVMIKALNNVAEEKREKIWK